MKALITETWHKSARGKSRVRILIDADVFLELFINRSGFVKDIEKLFLELAQSQQIEAYVTNKCLKRVRLELGDTDEQLGEQAAYKVEALLNGRIIHINQNHREEARKSALRDFDSAEELTCAIERDLDAIVTQNSQNFDGANLPVLSVSNFLERNHLEGIFENSISLVLLESGLVNIQLSLEKNIQIGSDYYFELQSSAAKLREAGLHGTDLHGVDLQGVDLRGVNLSAANLYGAKLREADLRGAKLRDTDLSGADLYSADLYGADLYGADLCGTDLSMAQVYSARFGKNLGISVDMSLNLRERGAIFT